MKKKDENVTNVLFVTYYVTRDDVDTRRIQYNILNNRYNNNNNDDKKE